MAGEMGIQRPGRSVDLGGHLALAAGPGETVG
jgi:hypothetical protein